MSLLPFFRRLSPSSSCSLSLAADRIGSQVIGRDMSLEDGPVPRTSVLVTSLGLLSPLSSCASLGRFPRVSRFSKGEVSGGPAGERKV